MNENRRMIMGCLEDSTWWQQIANIFFVISVVKLCPVQYVTRINLSCFAPKRLSYPYMLDNIERETKY